DVLFGSGCRGVGVRRGGLVARGGRAAGARRSRRRGSLGPTRRHGQTRPAAVGARGGAARRHRAARRAAGVVARVRAVPRARRGRGPADQLHRRRAGPGGAAAPGAVRARAQQAGRRPRQAVLGRGRPGTARPPSRGPAGPGGGREGRRRRGAARLRRRRAVRQRGARLRPPHVPRRPPARGRRRRVRPGGLRAAGPLRPHRHHGQLRPPAAAAPRGRQDRPLDRVVARLPGGRLRAAREVPPRRADAHARRPRRRLRHAKRGKPGEGGLRAGHQATLEVHRQGRDADLALRVAAARVRGVGQRPLHLLGQPQPDPRRHLLRELRDGLTVPA
ncbi:MAG: hypothetical protein AVDCRST_MAG64-3200, partial [uncultured Phycisphaerae bacterium]